MLHTESAVKQDVLAKFVVLIHTVSGFEMSDSEELSDSVYANLILFIPCIFLQSVQPPKNARNKIQLLHKS